MNRNFEQLQQMNAELASDHELLQRLHSQLTQEYERLQQEFADSKSREKQTQLHYHAQAERNDALARENADLLRLRDRIETERKSWERDLKQLATIQSEHGALKREYSDVLLNYERLKDEYEHVRMESRGMRSQTHEAQTQSSQWRNENEQIRNQLGQKELEIVKLYNKCQVY